MRRFAPILILAGLVVAGIVYLPGVSKYLKLKEREKALVREIERLDLEIRALKEEEELLKTDLIRLEEVVREKLGLVRPGEIVYKIVEEPPAPATAE